MGSKDRGENTMGNKDCEERTWEYVYGREDRGVRIGKRGLGVRIGE